MKAVPYIQTLGTDKYKNFVSSPFNEETLSYFNLNGLDVVFDGDYYHINKNKFIKPRIIDEFISDTHKLNHRIFWKESVLDEFQPKDYLKVEEIKDYYVDLLNKMDKSHELK